MNSKSNDTSFSHSVTASFLLLPLSLSLSSLPKTERASCAEGVGGACKGAHQCERRVKLSAHPMARSRTGMESYLVEEERAISQSNFSVPRDKKKAPQ